MAVIYNRVGIYNWVWDMLRHGEPQKAERYRGTSITLDEEGNLIYFREGKEGRIEKVMYRQYDRRTNSYRTRDSGRTRRVGFRSLFGPVILATYVRSTGTFVLNGDAFTDQTATEYQTFLRTLIQQPNRRHPDSRSNWNRLEAIPVWMAGKRRRTRRLSDGSLRYVIIPYQAMDGAQVDRTTVRPIDVTVDTFPSITHELPREPTQSDFKKVEPQVLGGNNFMRQRIVEKHGLQWRAIEQRHTQWNSETRTYEPQEWRITTRRGEFGKLVIQWMVRGREITGRVEWRFVQSGVSATDANGVAEIPRRPITCWQEQEHRLGASLFSAVGEDGRRHKFISAFDTQETPAMYFLAQLPDGSGATTYLEAMDALKPEIVRHAETQDLEIYRQGDVFAIETHLTDEQVYAMAQTRVRRSVVLNPARLRDDWLSSWFHSPSMQKSFPPVKQGEEVSEIVVCPCGCGQRARVSFGPRARRALMIYRTGHTADEVVVTRTGATYIRGTMYHDPHLEETGRRREHVDRPLGVTAKDRKHWMLACRNTVPRRSVRRIANDQTQDPGSTASQEAERVAA